MDIKPIQTRYKGYRLRGDEPSEPVNKSNLIEKYKGRVFYRLTVLEDLGVYRNGFRLFGCECSCGNKIAVRSRELQRGHTKSCGCLNSELLKERGGYNRKGIGVSAFNQLFFNYKKSARERNYEFRLTEQEFKDLVESGCFYCGSYRTNKAPRAKGTNGDFFYTGVDRINNKLGYIKGNVRPCCKQCNIAKGVLSEDVFFKWVKNISKTLSARFEHGETPGFYP